MAWAIPIVDDLYMNSPNQLKDLKNLEFNHKDFATKIVGQCLQHIFHGKKKSMAKQV